MTKPHYLLVYGSQTGQSEAISEQIALETPAHGLEVTLACAQDLDIAQIYKPNQVIVFVVSSTGEGDPPENFEKLWMRLYDAPPGAQLHYTILGLGDTNYTEYGGFPNKLHHLLSESGAQQFYEYQLADDAVGLEIVVEPWIEGLWAPLSACLASLDNNILHQHLLLQKIENLSLSEPSPTKMFYQLAFGEEDYTGLFPEGVENFILPFAVGELEKSGVVSKTRLSDLDERVKECLEFEIRTSQTYEAGDSFGLLCENSDVEVGTILKILGLGDKANLSYTLTVDTSVKTRLLPKHVLLNCSPYYALKYTLDLHTLPKKAFLKYLSECCTDTTESKFLYYLSSKEGSDDINEVVYKNSLSLADLLGMFPSCRPAFNGLLQFLPRLMPRYYSVSRVVTSQSRDVTSQIGSEMSGVTSRVRGIKFVLNVVEDIRPACDSKLPKIRGVCTSWLQGVTPQIGCADTAVTSDIGCADTAVKSDTGCSTPHVSNSPLYIYKRKNVHFKPTTEHDMIMIGAGTGVAPFLSFLDTLATSPHNNHTVVLITGNRYKELDSIYGTEFAEYKTSGLLSEYYTAYSRDAGYTCSYVQDVLYLHSARFIELLDGGAVVYVCGDAKGLAVSVFDTFKKILSLSKSVSEKEAEGILQDMKQSKRYLEDIWA